MIRKIPSVLLAIAICLPVLGAQEKAEVVSFKSRGPTVGEFQGSMLKTTNKNTVRMMRDGEESPERSMGSKATTNRDATILEVKDGAVTRVKLHWREVSRQNDLPEMAGGGRRGGRRGGGENAEPMPDVTELAGKTLILDLSAATPTLKDEEGKDASDGLLRLVTRMETSDGKFSGWSPDVLGILGKTEFTVGESIALSRENGAKIFGNAGGMRMRGMRGGRRGGRGGRGGEEGAAQEPDTGYSATLVFKGKRNSLGHDCGLFEINVTENSDRSNERMQSTSRTTMTGELLVGIENGWLYKLELKGKSSSDTSISMEERSMETSMEGSMDITRQVIYAKPKAQPAN